MSIIEKAIEKLNKNGDPRQSHAPVNMPNAVMQQDNKSEFADHARKEEITNDAIRGEKKSFDVEMISVSSIVRPEQEAPNLADELRRIKRPLLANAFGKQSSIVPNGNVIMVTSSLPGEGKSFTAANLAVSMAVEKDFTVLLIDADVAMSRISKMFDLEDSLGLTDLLSDQRLDIGKAIVKTDFPCLSIIPAGHKNPHAAELLGSNGMARIVAELATRYKNRIIMFDSPPLLATAESVILAENMGQIVVVVEANKTPQSAVLESIGMLNKDKPIGIVMNKTRRSFNYGQYGGYYGYGGTPKE